MRVFLLHYVIMYDSASQFHLELVPDQSQRILLEILTGNTHLDKLARLPHPSWQAF